MKTKKSITIISASVAVFLSLLYIIFAALPLTKEYNLVPEWNLNLTSPVLSSVPKDKNLIPFRLGQTAGYFT